MVTLAGLIGFQLAVDKSFATLPVTCLVVGTALATVPASLLMRRFGRRRGFMLGGWLGLSGALLACLAIYHANFGLFCAGSFVFGGFSAFAQYYRFAAADIASPQFKSKAISLVLAGGVVAGFIGPEIAKVTRELLPPFLFLGTYLAAVVLSCVTLAVQWFIDLPVPKQGAQPESGRPLAEIARQPIFMVAALSGMIGYGTMNLIMTATPLAMLQCGYPFDAAATVIQWHIVGMFGPSFFTGSLVNRFGVLRIIMAGVVLNLACAAIALSGTEVMNFWFALVMLGIGWNFMFVGGSTLLTEAYRPAERAKAQALNDFLVFGTVALASVSSGGLLVEFGWNAVIGASLPFVLLTGGVAWLFWSHHRRFPRAA